VRVIGEQFAATKPRPDRPSSGHLSFGQNVDVCFDGFREGPVEVTVTGPAGYTAHGVLHRLPAKYCSQGCLSYDWVPAIDASWPLGRYTISAVSGNLKSSATFEVVAPTEAGLRVLGPSTDPGHNQAPAHSYAKVFLAGFQHTRTVRLVVYRLMDMAGRAAFFSSAEVQIPTSGNTVIHLPTGRPDPNTTYIVTVQAADALLEAAFNVGPAFSVPGLVVGELPRQ
jgi:hypothetical protein